MCVTHASQALRRLHHEDPVYFVPDAEIRLAAWSDEASQLIRSGLSKWRLTKADSEASKRVFTRATPREQKVLSMVLDSIDLDEGGSDIGAADSDNEFLPPIFRTDASRRPASCDVPALCNTPWFREGVDSDDDEHDRNVQNPGRTARLDDTSSNLQSSQSESLDDSGLLLHSPLTPLKVPRLCPIACICASSCNAS